jgi:hypothetical protein
MKVGSATVPPNGIFQYQLLLTEPKPIGNSSTRPQLPTGPTGPVRGVAVNDASGLAVGIALVNGTNVTVSIQSPDSLLGTNIDYPLLILTMPISSTASGSFSVGMDPSSLFSNGGTQYTIQENVPGTLTIGGTMSITDVVPGGGAVKDGDSISVLGMGFDATTKIQVNNVTTVSTTFVSPGRIDAKLTGLCVPESNPCAPATTLQLDGTRIRAIKGNETVEYFSYDRTDDVPGTNNALVAQVHPMYSQQHFSAGTIPYTASATVFTGIALENTDTVADATVTVELLDASNVSLATSGSFVLGKRTQRVRAISDLFATIPASAATVRATVTTGPAIKMLGFTGDSSKGTVSPVVVAGQ